MNVRLRRPLDVISGRPQDVRLGRPSEGQIGSLGDVLRTLERDVLEMPRGPIFADWVVKRIQIETNCLGAFIVTAFGIPISQLVQW